MKRLVALIQFPVLVPVMALAALMLTWRDSKPVGPGA